VVDKLMLHIIKSSPFSCNSFVDCLAYLDDGDAILFIQDAVVTTASQHKYAQMLQDIKHQVQIYTLSEDLTARGLNCIMGQQIGYSEFVQLTLSHSQTQTWN
jgi:tRNA 2-thiouridine synthesizing protein B